MKIRLSFTTATSFAAIALFACVSAFIVALAEPQRSALFELDRIGGVCEQRVGIRDRVPMAPISTMPLLQQFRVAAAARIVAVTVGNSNDAANCASVKSLRFLHVFRSLQILALAGGRIRNSALGDLSGMQCKSLLIHCRQVSRVGLAGIKTMPGLEFLDLTGCAVGDDVIGLLARYQTLKELTMADTQLTDRGLAQLAKTLRLRRLDVAGTKLTDAAIEHLWRADGLAFVDLSRTHVSAAAVESLRARGVTVRR